MIQDHEVPLIRLFPKILNRKVFLNREHPKINPEIDRVGYVSYWREEKRRCIEGLWGEEKKGHWRYMNPDLYFYINHWLIELLNDSGEKEVSRPYLWDVVWYISSVWTVCRRFSGFQDDEEYNGHHLLKKYWQEVNGETDKHGELIELTRVDKKRLARSKYVKKKNGEYKKYRDPYEIISDSYEHNMGLPCYENPAQDLMLLGSRGLGKSYYVASCTAREYTFDGARYYKSETDSSFGEGGGKVFCGSQEDKHVNLLYDKVLFGLDHFSGGYETVDKSYPPPFYKERSGTFDSKYGVTHKYKVYYKIGGPQYKGTYSTMYKGVYSSNINQAIGNRVNQAFVDECGLILELPTVHGANRNVLERGGIKNASVCYTGTGGDIKKVDGAKSMFYNPRQNSLYAFNNVWEENSQGISMFIPAEYSLQDFKDPEGNTILEEAREEILRRRAEKAGGNDPTGYNNERMYMPIKPSDMFLVDGDLVYNQSRIMDRLSYLHRTEEWRENATFGQIKCFGNKFADVQIKRGKFEHESPIITRVVGDRDATTGSIIFHREPKGDEQFSLKGSRFRVVYDPVRKEGAEINRYRSFASILVWDTLHDDLAAEFIGRRETPEEIHDICLNLAIYYSSPILFETNVIGFKNAAQRRGLAYMLYPTPIGALSKKISGLKYKEGDVGVEVTSKTKPALIEFSQSFMNKKDGEGLDLYDKIQSLRLLEEMETWDGEINADHISSFLLLSVWEEEERGVALMERGESKNQYKDFKKVLERHKMQRRAMQSMYQT